MKLQIKEFAEFCDVSVRALHLYDKMGLFHPCYTDPHSHYRYYDTDQMLELNTIISFKKVGFLLSEIKEMKDQHLPKAAVINKLKEKLIENEKAINEATCKIDNIKQMLKGLDYIIDEDDPLQEEIKIAKMSCNETDKLERDFSQIIWL